MRCSEYKDNMALGALRTGGHRLYCKKASTGEPKPTAAPENEGSLASQH